MNGKEKLKFLSANPTWKVKIVNVNTIKPIFKKGEKNENQTIFN